MDAMQPMVNTTITWRDGHFPSLDRNVDACTIRFLKRFAIRNEHIMDKPNSYRSFR